MFNKINSIYKNKKARQKIKVFLASSICLALVSCAANPVTGNREFHFISQNQEIQLGEDQYDYMVQAEGGAYTLYANVNAYVQSVGNKLARVSDRPDLPYQFTVINDAVPNAWALPGGKIAINRGLLVYLKNEAELAAVLSHEIVHAAARHSAQRMEQGMLMNVGILGISQSTKGAVSSDLLDVGAQLIQLKYSRSAESEADHFGMIYMSRAGYDPAAAVSLQETFVKLSKSDKAAWGGGLFASHPPSEERVQANKRMLATLKKGGEIGATQYTSNLALVVNAEPTYENLSKGSMAYDNKQYSLAIQYADQAIRALPSEAKFYILRGAAEESLNQNQLALQDYDKAISLDSGYFLGYLKRGLFLQKTGQHDRARQDLNRSYQLLPTAAAATALKH